VVGTTTIFFEIGGIFMLLYVRRHMGSWPNGLLG